VLSPAVIGFAFGCWVQSQDLIIGMLGNFCRVCADHAAPNEFSTNLPAWHRGWWQKNSMRHREWLEIAFVFINVLGVVLANVYVTESPHSASPEATIALFANYVALGLSC